MYIEEIRDNDKCVGCGNCMNSCPVHAIKMSADKEGFLNPQVDHDTCINCGQCAKNCPTEELYYKDIQELPEIILARAKNQEITNSSASGGMCTLLSRYFIEELHGYVCGAVYDEKFQVKHIITNNLEDIEKMQHSKYTQSNFNNCVTQIRTLLQKNNYVLVIGTTCQIYALKKLLGKEYSNLLCVDLVCHGVPSPLVQKEYIKYLENKHGDIKTINNRYKRFYPHSYTNNYYVLWSSGKESIKKYSDDPMSNAFFSHLSIRKCCYDCQFKSIHRISDLTIGDFWFSEQFDFGEDKNGINLCLIQSEKGKESILDIGDNIDYKNIDPRTAIVLNGGMLYRSCAMNKNRQKFFDGLGKCDFNELVKQYDNSSKKDRIKYFLRELTAPIIRRTKYYNKTLAKSAKNRAKKDIPENKRGLLFY